MSLYAFAAPVLPGKTDKLRELAAALGTKAEAKSVRALAGIDRERLYLQEMPQGDVVVVVWDTNDGAHALKTLSSGSDEFSMWFRAQVADIHGIDVSDPTSVPTPELLAQWSSPDVDPSGADFAFLVPIGRGRVEGYRSMVDAMFSGAQRDGFEATRKLLGVTRQTMFLLETPMGEFALPVLEGPGAPRVFGEQLKRDDHPFFDWWRGQLRSVTGRIPTSPPKVEKILDLKVRVPVTSRR